jgi:hypothetical protein
MKLSFRNEADFTKDNVKKVSDSLKKKTTVVLHHADFCGHCHAMRSEFEDFKRKKEANVVEFESNSLDTLQRYKTIYNRVTPPDRSIYFPMIFIFIKRVGKSPLRKQFKQERTSAALSSFIHKNSALLKQHEEKKKQKAKELMKIAHANREPFKKEEKVKTLKKVKKIKSKTI